MSPDEQAIRALIADWGSATTAGDLSRLLPLMAEDVVFLIPGQPPLRGRDAFALAFQTAAQQVRIEPVSEVQEIVVAGELAYCWNHIVVTMTPRSGGSPFRHSGHTLTVLRRDPAGHWVVARDANLLTPGP